MRYLIKDEPIQAQLAIELIKNNQCFVLKTVILETVWVLSSKQGYALERNIIINRIQHLLKLPSMVVEDINEVILAVHWYSLGMDFADALHLAASLETKEFVTFDRKMVSKASAIDINQFVTLLAIER